MGRRLLAGRRKHVRIGGDTPQNDADLQHLEAALAAEPKQHVEPLWLVLIGHGTFDGRQAKFNLRGPDLTAEQLGQWLAPFQRTVVVINCASASSPFMKQLSGKNRVVITSTKSGYQYNYAHFGDYLSQVIGDPQADLDKDGQTSLLEAYLLASAQVQEFYKQDARLATEQSLLDDNGDALGTPADWFRGVRAVKKPTDDAEVDGVRANQLQLVRSDREQHMSPESRQHRDALESKIVQLRERKESLDSEEYYQQLLPLMLELARLYQSDTEH